ncbi:MAG: hypothetical protein RL091_3441 [Verrucomicrobiota bacterium]|jgi:hypothetical protein
MQAIALTSGMRWRHGMSPNQNCRSFIAAGRIALVAGLVAVGGSALLSAKTHLIEAATRRYDAVAAGVEPGDTVLIAAGVRGPLRIAGLRGDPRNTVVVRPAGALVINGGKDHYAIAFADCTDFHFTGLVDSANPSAGRLRIESGQNSVVVTGFSSGIELSHLEVADSGFAGIMIKQDPTDDPRTWRDAFVMRRVTVRDCVITHTQGEGLYLGNSFYATGHPAGEAGKRWAHTIEGVRVFRNRTYDTGCEGLQVGSATKDCEIVGNTIEKFGQRPFGPWQDNGLQIGEGTGGLVQDNVIRDGPGNGIVLLGLGDNRIIGNLIEQVGGRGINGYSRAGAISGDGYHIEGNVIRTPGGHGIALGAPELKAIVICGNRIIHPGQTPAIALLDGTKADVRDNRIE